MTLNLSNLSKCLSIVLYDSFIVYASTLPKLFLNVAMKYLKQDGRLITAKQTGVKIILVSSQNIFCAQHKH